MTPLHIGAYWGHDVIVQLLCECGANPLMETTTRKLPVDLVPPDKEFNRMRAYLQGITAAAQLTGKDSLTTILNGIAIVAVRVRRHPVWCFQTLVRLRSTAPRIAPQPAACSVGVQHDAGSNLERNSIGVTSRYWSSQSPSSAS